MNDNVQAELKKIFNGRFSTSESTRANYARGEDTYEPVLSKAVVFPETNEEVLNITLPSLFICTDVAYKNIINFNPVDNSYTVEQLTYGF